MLSYNYLLNIAVILLSTKMLGLLTRKFQMPQVVGALVAGLILGPAVLNIVKETEFIAQMAELGVIVLMFSAGLETDIKELKKTGKISFFTALLGVLVPLIIGFIVAVIFNEGFSNIQGGKVFLQNVFIGVILTATSVSITVETLKEIGKLSTRAGNVILGAALIDDVMGIVALTIITSLADTSVNVWGILFKLIMFFVFAIVFGMVFYYFFNKWMKRYNDSNKRFVILAFVFCLLLAYIAERYFGVADITGAFIAGLFISNTQKTEYITSRFETLSYMLLSPIFFASIGIKVDISTMSSSIIIFTVVLTIAAILSKVLGCGIGAKLCKCTNMESIQIGTGMISRGEVALIVATKGLSLGLVNQKFLAPIVIMVVITTVITPILLKIVFRKDAVTG